MFCNADSHIVLHPSCGHDLFFAFLVQLSLPPSTRKALSMKLKTAAVYAERSLSSSLEPLEPKLLPSFDEMMGGDPSWQPGAEGGFFL